MSSCDRPMTMREAGESLGRSYRWMQRNYLTLIKRGVVIYRVPKDSIKGHLLFDPDSLTAYLRSCQLKGEFGVM